MKIDKDNILGWTKEDFTKVELQIAECRLLNNISLTPSLLKAYCSAGDEQKISYIK